MFRLLRCRLRHFVVLLFGAAALVLPAPCLQAQMCPQASIAIQRPAMGAVDLCGVVRFDIGLSAPPDGWSWGNVQIIFTDSSSNTVETGIPTQIGTTTSYYYDEVTYNHLNGAYTATISATLSTMGAACGYQSPSITVHYQNPCHTRSSSAQKLQSLDTRDAVCTGSSTSPLTGDQSFTVPITSWDYKGATIPFAITYDSIGATDPGQPTTPNFNGLSERNSKWSQPFAQWIDLWQDETGQEYAVWHHGNSTLAFRRVAGMSGVTYTSPDSYHTLTGGGGGAVSPSFPCDGGSQTLMADFSTYTLRDQDNTEYDFTMLDWQTGTCTALPHYLLTRILDRWGRQINITWSNVPVGSGTEPRVTMVMDNGDMSIGQQPRGITLMYPNGDGLLLMVSDPEGRTHTLSYAGVPDEESPPVNRQKLSGVAVTGPGDNSRVVYTWSFLYQAPNDPMNLAYGGTYTGDLVVQKSEPDGQVTSYQYEPVALTDPNRTRPREADWDGRVTQISWTDRGDGSTKTITRIGGTTPTLTFPGALSVQYGYGGLNVNDVTSVTDVSTSRTWQYTSDARHNLLTVRTPLEATGNPLVQYSPAQDANGHITDTTETVLQDGTGNLGDPVTTLFNSLNEPTQITATARVGGGNVDQVTMFHYDNDGPLTTGNLTAITEAFGTALQQETDLTYGGPDGKWGLPDTVKNVVGGISNFTYDHPTGRLLTAASPQNLIPEAAPDDNAASMTMLAYNGDGLPSLVQDPLGHQESITYNAASPGSSNLLVTITHMADGSARSVVLDPFGRVLQSTDERGIVTVWTYNSQGQVIKIQRAAGTAAERDTVFHYNAQGDLDYLIPPDGAADEVQFDYRRYQQNGMLDPSGAYEGQVTKITYPATPDFPMGTSELFGYNNAGELAWHVKADGSLITIAKRDALHRITEIDYPAAPGGSAFHVTAQYDEFGRITNTSDAIGPTSLAYDVLNRLTGVTPPGPQEPVTYGYSPDSTLHRWITTATVPTVGTYAYQEDPKGRLGQVVNPFNQKFVLQYDLDGKNTSYRFPNGMSSPVREARSYNARDWLTNIAITAANGSMIDNFAYGYSDTLGNPDPTGQLHTETDMGNRVHVFSYNKLYELVYESHPDFGSIVYSYDRNGNRLTRSVNGVCDYYGVDANNKLQWVNHNSNGAPTSGQANPYMLFSYDANGNMKHRERRYENGLFRSFDLLWDGADNLRQANEVSPNPGTPFAALYNGAGLRVQETDNWNGTAGTHHFTWGLGGVLLDDAGTEYTPGFSERQGGADQFYDTDWLGSTRYLTDVTGDIVNAALRFDAFGNRSATGDLPSPYDPSSFQFGAEWGYQTSYADTMEPGLGLQYLERRYYDPAIGRFLNADPLGFDGGLNLYAYCENDPVNVVDPDGQGGVWIGGVRLGDDHPWLVFDVAVADRGLRTGAAGVVSAFTYGRVDVGCYRNQPGFGGSLLLAGIGREALIQAAASGLARFLGPVLSKIPRPALKLRPGFVALPMLGGDLGGRLGTLATRLQLRRIAADLVARGWTIERGGAQIPELGEEFLPGATGGVRGSAYPDLTATKVIRGRVRWLRINTVDTLANGVTPTADELRNAARIRSLTPGDHLLLVPKP